MANLRSSLLRKLKRALSQKFPSADSIRLEDHDGIIGVVTSTDFEGMDPIDRQNLISEIIEANLVPEERHQVQIIVGVTPEEGTGYLAAVD